MINEIIDSFRNLTPILWVSQMAGIIGFILVGISYQFNKKNFLIISGVSYIFFFIEQLLAAIYANVIVTALAIFRNLILLFFIIKKKKEAPVYYMYIIVGLIWIVEAIYFIQSKTYDNWLNYIPPVLTTIYSLVANHKNYYVVKGGALALEVGNLYYYLAYHLPFSAIRQIVLSLSIIISLIIMIIKTIRNKNSAID